MLGWSNFLSVYISLANYASFPWRLFLSIILMAYYFVELFFIVAKTTLPKDPIPSTLPKLYKEWMSVVEVKIESLWLVCIGTILACYFGCKQPI